ncbi:MAG: TIM barrel protein [Armatimonadota bacterium]|nr:TIM barrel protein [Armatimonadota bacterium]
MPYTRRALLTAAGAATLGSALSPAGGAPVEFPAVKNGRVAQSVSRWCFGRIPLGEFAGICKRLGLGGIDLLGPSDFGVLKEHGLVCTMTNSHGIAVGLNRKENHARCLEALRQAIEATAAAGFPNVITFSGNRGEGIDDESGAANCVEALKQIASFAEEKKVTICMELLNSKVNHKGYMCDRTAWGAAVCRAVGSPRVKLLYDIYHMQIQEGDIIRTLREFKEYIGHVHTGGVPGRNEIDDTQELNYPAIMRALVEMGYTGWVAHEFVPKGDPVASLAQAVRLCDV